MRTVFKFRFWAAVTMAAMMFASCDKDEEPRTAVEANGLTRDINELISPEILQEIEELGMPINRGGNPPEDITGKYLVSPDVCVATNRPDDEFGPGHVFNDFYLTLSEQDNSKLTIKAATAQGSHSGEGTGAYLVGEGNSFTVFCPMDNTTGSGHVYKNVAIFSGTLTAGGIKDLYHSTFILEGGGSQWYLIEDGQGRVAFDSDGMSEKIAGATQQSAHAMQKSSIAGTRTAINDAK
jgi:hypothetical protein